MKRFAFFFSYVVLLLQISLGSYGQKFYVKDNSQQFFMKTENNRDELFIEKSKTNPQRAFLTTEYSKAINPNEVSIDKSSKTNPQEFFTKTKFNRNFVETSIVNLQSVFIKKHPHHRKGHGHGGHHHQGLNPAFNVFFKLNDLHLGGKILLYFFESDKSSPFNLLSRDESDSIPFSSSSLPFLLESFSIPNHSPEAETMKDTLKLCEATPKDGEFKFCASSLESMIDKTRGFLGNDVKLNALTTKILSSNNHVLLQNYTIVKKPLEINADKKVACHTMPYPYMVYYCHGHEGHSNKMFKLSLLGENGERVEAVAACHMDTSTWSPNHVSFEMIGGKPGVTPVCHILPTDNIAWIPSP